MPFAAPLCKYAQNNIKIFKNVSLQPLIEGSKVWGKVRSLTLELSYQRARENVLNRFKHVKTCILAREHCLLVRTNRAALDKKRYLKWWKRKVGERKEEKKRALQLCLRPFKAS